MARAGNHRIGSVRFTLMGNTAMGMYVTDYRELSIPTKCPEFGEGWGLKDANPAVVSALVELIVENDVSYDPNAALDFSEKKRASFMALLATAVKFARHRGPDFARAAQPVLRSYECPNNRSK
jgi:hypothetical protein